MTATERRQAIFEALTSATAPLNGTELAETYGVSRQIIVQDVALLRAAGHKIFSTSRGYLLEQAAPREKALDATAQPVPRAFDPMSPQAGSHPVPSARVVRLIKVRHTSERTADELNAIVDLGGCVENVMVNHRTYGRMEAPLNIKSRRDARRFLDDLAAGVSSPLMAITDGYHFHLVSADAPEVLDEIEDALGELGILAPLTDYERDTFARE